MGCKKIPIGIEDFEEIYTGNYYYIDKTMFIKALLDRRFGVKLFTRPEKFGKTLMLSMLRYYFEADYDKNGNKVDHSHIFEGKAIMETGENYLRHMGQYPVIFLSLKCRKSSDIDSYIAEIKTAIAMEFQRHSYVLNGDMLSLFEKNMYQKYMDGTALDREYINALRFLSKCLELWSEKQVIILIDEYDAPQAASSGCDFYNRLLDFTGGLLENTLQTNDHLYFGVVTGCLYVSRESFSISMYNWYWNSILRPGYGEYFGFTDSEVQKLCEDYNMPQRSEEIRRWYGGYVFDKSNVYNPWSTLNYIADYVLNVNEYPKAYRTNEHYKSIIKELIRREDDTMKWHMEDLIAGGTITIPVHEGITYNEIYDSPENYWNYMFFTGYLRNVAYTFDTFTHERMLTLKITNYEVDDIFRKAALEWFEEKVKEMDRRELFTAFAEGNCENLTKELNKYLRLTIGFRDFYKKFYHEFLKTVLTGMDGYGVKSNRESGKEKTVLLVTPLLRLDTAFVIEMKMAKEIKALRVSAEEAIDQIVIQRYEEELHSNGYEKIKRYGISFFHKDCLIVTG